MSKIFMSFVFGLLFGTGILMSGMANPAKVLNFFDVFGTWDPSLMFVMGGALAITMIGYRLVFRMKTPLLETGFHLPALKPVDRKLVLGASLFGIGWGISGFCPGGLVPALGLGRSEPFIMLLAVLVGMTAYRLFANGISRPLTSKPTP